MDEKMWMMGSYVLSATLTAIDKGLNGKKAKSEYIDKPFLHNMSVDILTAEQEQMRNLKHLETQAKIRKANKELAQRRLERECSKEKKNG